MADRLFLRIASLDGHEAWAALREHVEAEREKQIAALAREMMSGTDSLNRESLAYQRGKYAGMKVVLDLPGQAAKQIEKERGK